MTFDSWRIKMSRNFLQVSLLSTSIAVSGAAVPEFSRDVRPLLSDKCFSCHGPDENDREADLRLDVPENTLQDRGGYHIVVPGDPDASELIARIMTRDPDLRMPPGGSGKNLTPDEIRMLRQWIAAGAPMTDHWAFVPPRRHAMPRLRNRSWGTNWIDRFILARLESEGLQPSPDADPVTLIRRLHFDLTGLPPSMDVVAAFSADPSAENLESLVDQLLASEACAERLAMYWLDLVRYADTVGYHGDQTHNVSPYRNWVIDAFASNMPFDRFTREQLAGDLVPDSDVDQKISSGYNRLLQTSHEGGVQPKEYLAIYAADRIRNLSAVWLGATVGCAQCHDHKYDPYTMRDFYSLVAFFADLDEDNHFYNGGNGLPTKRLPEIDVHSRREREQLHSLEDQLAQLHQRPHASADRQRIKQAIEQIRRSARPTMISVAKEPRIIRILPRGNWLDDSGEVVQPAIPAFLGSISPSSGDRATRLDLAGWLTDAENGHGLMTARVFANRFWYLLFRRGLARMLDDFGSQGDPPDYPELLDRLAIEFVESGWNVRHMLRLIVMSRTWRQSSSWTDDLRRVDPENQFVARQNSFRLPAEMIRDNALQVSGLLVNTIGGPSVRPYQPAGYYRHLNFPKRTYSHDTDDGQWRRGLYVHWQRQFLHPMLRAFDAPRREECTAQRPQSNTPLAALTLLNDPTFVEAARAFAVRILGETESDDVSARVEFAMREAVSRPPDVVEQAVLTKLLEYSRADNRQFPDQTRQVVRVGLRPAPDDIDIDELASWTVVARAIFNLDEMITRN